MEISLQMYTNIEIMVPLVYRARSRPKGYKLRIVSCKAYKAMQINGKTNFYEVLALGSDNVGFDEIKKAYRNMALRYHPDVCPPSNKEESTRRFVHLQEAYETLSDPISRKMYDYELGLAETSLGWRFGGHSSTTEERMTCFSREVWERQLSGLRKRSVDRMERKLDGYMQKES